MIGAIKSFMNSFMMAKVDMVDLIEELTKVIDKQATEIERLNSIVDEMNNHVMVPSETWLRVLREHGEMKASLNHVDREETSN